MYLLIRLGTFSEKKLKVYNFSKNRIYFKSHSEPYKFIQRVFNYIIAIPFHSFSICIKKR